MSLLGHMQSPSSFLCSQVAPYNPRKVPQALTAGVSAFSFGLTSGLDAAVTCSSLLSDVFLVVD